MKRNDEKRASVKSVDAVKKSSTENIEKPTPPQVSELVDSAAVPVKSGEADLDSIQRGDRLVHPTADRVRAPKRRPPSSVFVKEAVSSYHCFYTSDKNSPIWPANTISNLNFCGKKSIC
jgi:organic radical activating enzyme